MILIVLLLILQKLSFYDSLWQNNAMNIITEKFLDVPTGIFTSTDVALTFPGTDDSRHAKVKRALASKEIQGVRRGLYCLARPYRRYPINVYALAQRVHGPSYVSMESALSYHGWIPESVRVCTSTNLKRQKVSYTLRRILV